MLDTVRNGDIIALDANFFSEVWQLHVHVTRWPGESAVTNSKQ